MRPIALLALFAWPCSFAFAEQNQPTDNLPEPLTLEFALSLAESDHPQIRMAESAIASARGAVSRAESDTGLTVGIEARASWIDPPAATAAAGNDDHRLQRYARKRLYD